MFNLGRVNPQDGVIIIGNLLLSGRPRRLRLPNGGLHLVRKNRQPFLVEPVVVRGDESTHFFDERLESRLVLLHSAALGEDFAGGGQVQPTQHERIKQRFHGIIIGLRDRVVKVIVAFGAADGHSQEGTRDGLDRGHGQLLVGIHG